MARVSSSKIARAFVKGVPARCNNTVCDGESVYLHGHKIAWMPPHEEVHFSLCGWPTRTTMDRLNHIFDALNVPLRLCTIKFEPHVYNYKTGVTESISSRLPYVVTDFIQQQEAA